LLTTIARRLLLLFELWRFYYLVRFAFVNAWVSRDSFLKSLRLGQLGVSDGHVLSQLRIFLLDLLVKRRC